MHLKSASGLASVPSSTTSAERTRPPSRPGASTSPSICTESHSQEAIYENVQVCARASARADAADPRGRPSEAGAAPVPLANAHSHLVQLDAVSAAIDRVLQQQSCGQPPPVTHALSSLTKRLVHTTSDFNMVSRPSSLLTNPPTTSTAPEGGGGSFGLRSGYSVPNSLLLESLRQRPLAPSQQFPSGATFHFPAPAAPQPSPTPTSPMASCSPVYANYAQISAAASPRSAAASMHQERKFSAPVPYSPYQNPNSSPNQNRLQAIAFGSSLMASTGGRVHGRRHELLMRMSSGPNAQYASPTPVQSAARGSPAGQQALPSPACEAHGGRVQLASNGRILPPRFRPSPDTPSASSANSLTTTAPSVVLPIRPPSNALASPSLGIVSPAHGPTSTSYPRPSSTALGAGASSFGSGTHGRPSCSSPMSPLVGDVAKIAGAFGDPVDSRGGLYRTQSTRAATASANGASSSAAAAANALRSLTATRLLASSRASGSSSSTTSARVGAGSKHK